ncbi:MAG: DEAD/DEAH box helicase [Patescibacteria group bacterium]
MNNRHFSNGNKTRKSFGSFSKPSFSRGGFRPRFSRKGPPRGENINVSKFINKAGVSETEVKFVPVHKFSDFAIDEILKHSIVKKGYVIPTPIQDQAIPPALLGRDILGIANTGTGKTGAFLIPLINKVLKNRKEQVLIIVPTRELALQVDQELRGFTYSMKIFSVCVVGGMSIGRQISQLRYQNNFIIGTPGRLKDLVDRKMIRLSEFSTVVLDEADRMLDMGFINDMREVMAGMPKERQTLFFSATLSSTIEKLIGEFLRDPVRISVKKGDTSKNVDQDIVRLKNGENKIDVLHDLLIKEGFSKVLIFGRTKHGVEKLSVTLTERGFKAESIHGNKNHSQRQRALGKFKDNHAQVLVATDVAARGLDIADVSHVINYDLPQTYDDYVHRIGRTGRGDKQGKALTFIE